MATISVSNISEGEPRTSEVWTGRAGEAITAGNVVVYDINENNDDLYLYSLTDADRQGIHGIALRDAAAGQKFPVLISGFVKGLTLDPTGTATHRTGNPVYTGATGTLDTATAVGAVIVGRLRALSNSVGLYVKPEFS